ncbi:Osmotin thaumatin-like protein [Desarmillaria tabescens]|uniref:Osmotin thaumatin-like protein n=1 Tax=Armillaria tabescens TaxID=1929756 RepID=A0AA39N435_ARMTA|nr:Osmotin thaumatin-like protein [Desarmillaria tabescens]KAK0457456.1 Osmotin thaumatin-like protein [Desarmillaria tabescens]
MKNVALSFGLLVALISSASAFTITFRNNCWLQPRTVFPDTSVSFGTTLAPGASASFGVDDHQLGIRAWGRTGCNSNGANCATGGCNGGLVCTDAGITSGVILSEYGYANFGAQYGGERTSWDLSRVDSAININTRLSSSDGTTVTCTTSSCPDNQAYSYATDYAADRNSALGQTYTHTFCP